MPLVQVFTSAAPPAPSERQALLSELSRLAAARFDKPERWVMTCLVPGVAMTFGGTDAPAAFVAVKNIGKMTPDDTAALSRDLCG
jgi:phenylpyruvate tautomerase